MNPEDIKLYLVTDRSLSLNRPLEYIVEEAIQGGVTMVQLREKSCSSLEFYELAVEMKKILKPYRIPLIINDRVDIALACKADGVHIGQHDLPYPVVRKLMGKNKIIGLSVETLEDVKESNRWDLDYIGISPVFGTPTKTDTALPLGLEGVKEITGLSCHPAVAIGGIHPENATEIMRAGADGIAVVSAIMSAPDPKQAAQELTEIIYQSKRTDEI